MQFVSKELELLERWHSPAVSPFDFSFYDRQFILRSSSILNVFMCFLFCLVLRFWLPFSAQQEPFKAGMYFIFTLEFNSELTVTKKQLQDQKAHKRKQYKKINKYGF